MPKPMNDPGTEWSGDVYDIVPCPDCGHAQSDLGPNTECEKCGFAPCLGTIKTETSTKATLMSESMNLGLFNEVVRLRAENADLKIALEQQSLVTAKDVHRGMEIEIRLLNENLTTERERSKIAFNFLGRVIGWSECILEELKSGKTQIDLGGLTIFIKQYAKIADTGCEFSGIVPEREYDIKK